MRFYFSDTRSGGSVGGSLDGIVPGGFTFTTVSGTCAWAGEEAEILGEKPKHFLPLLQENEPCGKKCKPDWTCTHRRSCGM